MNRGDYAAHADLAANRRPVDAVAFKALAMPRPVPVWLYAVALAAWVVVAVELAR